jgi:hypothetical protein
MVKWQKRIVLFLTKKFMQPNEKRSAYVELIVIGIVQFIFFISYNLFDEHSNVNYDWYRFLTPGILFSFFLIGLNQKKFNIQKAIIPFFILLIFYLCSLFSGIYSWGFTVPFTGGAGGLLIRGLFGRKANKYFLWGFVAGLLGLILFYFLTCCAKLTYGLSFGTIILIWQITIGIVFINDSDYVNNETIKIEKADLN